MPGINDIHIELQCQQNLSKGGPIEEFAPRKRLPSDPEKLFMPELYDRETNTCSVFIPIFPRAQFFLKYETMPPEQPEPVVSLGPDGWPVVKDNGENNNVFYVFQLFISNDEITTWSCGEQQGWQGKISFALYDTSDSEVHLDGKALQKRVFMFNGDYRITGDMTCDKDEDRKIEVRVFRADKSMRTPKQPESYEGQGMTEEIRTPFGGNPTSIQPKKYFIFGLLDPLDQPHVVFRWYYRSWEEIHNLRLRLGEEDDEESESIFTGIQVTKHHQRKTINVKRDATVRMGPQQHQPPWAARSILPLLQGSQRDGISQPPGTILMASNVLRYDRATGSIVPMQIGTASNTRPFQLKWNNQDESESRRFSADSALGLPRRCNTENVDPRRLSLNGPESPNQTKHSAVQIHPATLLPPQHPHAKQLPASVPLQYQHCVQPGQQHTHPSRPIARSPLRKNISSVPANLVPPQRGGRGPDASPNVKAWRHI